MEPAQMTCVTNTMYHTHSKISSAWIPSVRKEVSNRELQVDLMCSSLFFLIFRVHSIFLPWWRAMVQYTM